MQDAKEMVRRCVEIRYYKRKLWMWLMVFLTLTLCVEVMFFTQDLLIDKITQRLMIGVALFLFYTTFLLRSMISYRSLRLNSILINTSFVKCDLISRIAEF